LQPEKADLGDLPQRGLELLRPGVPSRASTPDRMVSLVFSLTAKIIGKPNFSL
jgi:hypothetical protein